MNPERPEWLPDLVDLSGTNEQVTARLYEVFKRDFDDTPLFFRHHSVRYNNQMQQGYPEHFWHIVERERKDADWREPEPKRAERLAWCAAVIRNANDSRVRKWNYPEQNGEQHVYLWLEAWDYLVVLNYRPHKQRGKVTFFLVTAFVVDEERKREDLEAKWNNRYPL